MKSAGPEASTSQALAFDLDLHVQYLVGLKNKKEDFESCMTEHMRVSGLYWGVGAMALLDREDEMQPAAIVDWVL